MNIVLGILSSFPEVEEAIIYGSRAKGNYHTGSDIDITLKGETLNHKVLNTIINEFDDSFLAYMVDVSIFKEIDNPGLTEHINRVGQVLYKKSFATSIETTHL